MDKIFALNPLTRLDYPDPDVIRVGDAYYMASTTMYFMPGCVILRSYDLANWEFFTHVYDILEDTPRENLDGQTAYGCGMWAPTLRYHDGVFHVVFIANDTKKTYHYAAKNIAGPWKKSCIEGFYHDPSLLFDDDGRVYIMYGNRDIRVTELKADLSGPKPGGVDKIVIRDAPKSPLGYEGSHLYKINGKYYAFFIHGTRDRWFRVEAAFMADSIEGPWTGKDVICDEFGEVSGVAQGGIVDAPDGDWYGVIFSDMGAAGRIPNLIPMSFDETGFPVFEKTRRRVGVKSTRPEHEYAPLYVSDSFDSEPLNGAWEWNHNPVKDKIRIGGGLRLEAMHAENFEMAKNTLTQRALYPRCSAEVTVDASELKDGGFAGIAALQYRYGALGISKTPEGYAVRLILREDGGEFCAEEFKINSPRATLRVSFEFGIGKDYAEFYIREGKALRQIGGRHFMNFDLRHFTGCRFGLFCYTTSSGGAAKFNDFRYIDSGRAGEALKELSDPKYRDLQAKIVPGLSKSEIIGVRTPDIRRLAKSLEDSVRERFLDELPHSFYDENVLHSAILCNISDFSEAAAMTEKFLPYIDNWAVCDALSPKGFKKNRPELLKKIRGWLKSDKPYTVRFGLEMLMAHFLDEDFKEEYLDLAAEVRSEEYYVNMMQAWYFATALAKQWSCAVKIIENRRLSDRVHNKTIQKAVESYRLSGERKKYLKSLRVNAKKRQSN